MRRSAGRLFSDRWSRSWIQFCCLLAKRRQLASDFAMPSLVFVMCRKRKEESSALLACTAWVKIVFWNERKLWTDFIFRLAIVWEWKFSFQNWIRHSLLKKWFTKSENDKLHWSCTLLRCPLKTNFAFHCGYIVSMRNAEILQEFGKQQSWSNLIQLPTFAWRRSFLAGKFRELEKMTDVKMMRATFTADEKAPDYNKKAEWLRNWLLLCAFNARKTGIFP